MAEFSATTAADDLLPPELLAQISSSAVADQLPGLLSQLLKACRTVGVNLRDCAYSSDAIGTQNDFGDNQLDVDVKCDAVIFQCLTDSGVVHVGSSEESPVEVSCGGAPAATAKGTAGYSVAFDPLDGSSIVDANFAVGTIVGVWPGSTLLNRTGREQSCAFVCQYGPRVTIALALNGCVTADGAPTSMELTMHRDKWVVSVPKFAIAAKGKTFAPGNLRAAQDNPKYGALVQYWIENKYTLRYSGGLVPDVYHILIKKQGVLSNASSASCKAKLRLLFEAAPIALIVEAAGGASCVCATEVAEATAPLSLLDVPISDLDKRVGVCYGSSEEVDRFKAYIFG